MSKTIIVGSNNTSIGSTSIIGGSNNISIGTCGSQGLYGAIGQQGIQGQAGYMTDWKDELMKKYTRFTITTEYEDRMTFAPTNIIIDNNTKEEYKFKPKSSDIMNETDNYIQQLIISIRDQKITNIINGL